MKKYNMNKKIWVFIFALIVTCGFVIDYAIAQSGVISLNTAVSFPVDI